MQSIECNDVNWSTPKIHHVNTGIFPTDFAFSMWRICNLGLALTNQWLRNFQHGVQVEKVGVISLKKSPIGFHLE